MAKIARAPFRFDALPREMQVHVAEMLDLNTLKNLSMTSKKVRSEMLAVLFKSIKTPRAGNGRPVTLSPTSVGSVQSANLVFGIYSNGDLPEASDLWTCNCAFLPNLINLRKVTLTLQIGHCVDMDDLERPLPVIQAVIRTCCLISRAAALSVVIQPSVNFADALQVILAPLIDALSDSSTVSLTVGEMRDADGLTHVLDSPADVTRSQLQGMLTRVESLRLSTCWLNWMTGNLNMQNLVELELTIGYEMFDEGVTSAISEHLPLIIRSSGPRLKSIKIDSDLSYDEIVENNLFVTALPPLRREVDHLCLAGSTFTTMPSLLASVSGRRLDLTIWTSEDWHALEDIVCRKPYPIPQTEVLNITWREGTIFGDGQSQWKLHYTAIRQAVHNAGARVTLNIEHVQSGAIQDILASLRHVREELLVFECGLGNAPFDPLAAYESRTLVNLPICTRLCFYFAEHSSETHNSSAQSSAFIALMRYLQAPCVEELALDIGAPHPGYLVGLVDAIRRGQFPRLKRLVGAIRHYPTGKDPWPREELASYKNALQSVCVGRDISTHQLVWW